LAGSKSVIPEDLHGEVQRLHREGQGYKAIAEWLGRVHRVECSHMSVSRLLDRLESAPPPARPVIVPSAALPPTASPSDEESLRHWKRRAHLEAVAAERLIEEDPKVWQRYHSAMRLIATFDSALDKKRQFEAEFGDGSGRVPLTADEEFAAVEAARQSAVSVYDLQDPSTLPVPGPGVPLDEGGRPMPN
jgi:hypothetical protein